MGIVGSWNNVENSLINPFTDGKYLSVVCGGVSDRVSLCVCVWCRSGFFLKKEKGRIIIIICLQLTRCDADGILTAISHKFTAFSCVKLMASPYTKRQTVTNGYGNISHYNTVWLVYIKALLRNNSHNNKCFELNGSNTTIYYFNQQKDYIVVYDYRRANNTYLPISKAKNGDNLCYKKSTWPMWQHWN